MGDSDNSKFAEEAAENRPGSVRVIVFLRVSPNFGIYEGDPVYVALDISRPSHDEGVIR